MIINLYIEEYPRILNQIIFYILITQYMKNLIKEKRYTVRDRFSLGSGDYFFNKRFFDKNVSLKPDPLPEVHDMIDFVGRNDDGTYIINKLIDMTSNYKYTFDFYDIFGNIHYTTKCKIYDYENYSI